MFSLTLSSLRRPNTAADFIRFIFCAWLLAAAAELILLQPSYRDLSRFICLKKMSFLRLIFVAGIIVFLQWLLCRYCNNTTATRWIPIGAFAILSVTALRATFTWQLLGSCVLIAVILIVYGCFGWNAHPSPTPLQTPVRRIWYWCTALGTTVVFLFLSVWTVARVYSFSTPTYDFGIFSQMFYYMKETGLPLTTVERDTLLSHFAVHMSPIYYLLLPFYWLFPYPATLQVLQAAILASAVIPLWKLCGHFGLTGIQRTLLCAILLLSPAYAGGASFDIHENCFLAPLLLWMFYGIVKGNTPLTFTSALLTLMVKEDAAIYVAVAAIWLLIHTLLQKGSRKDVLTGTGLLTVSVLWFLVATTFLKKYGDGVMANRYINFMYPGATSLVAVIRSVLTNPMKLLHECTSPEKVRYISLTLLPLLGLPLLTRRYERYILLIPYILVNLMPDYPHQHQLFFQYNFGSMVFLLFLMVINLADWKISSRRTAVLLLSATLVLGCFTKVVVPKAIAIPRYASLNWQKMEDLRTILDEIPEEASVSATTYYASYLSQRKTLYTMNYTTQEHILASEYVVLNPSQHNEFQNFTTNNSQDGLSNLITLLEANGFIKIKSVKNRLLIYQKGAA